MKQDIKEVIIDSQKVKQRIRELAKELSAKYDGRNPLLIGILNGSAPFLVELILHMDIELEYEFMDISSYEGTESKELKINKDIDSPLENRDVIIVEDIVDTGRTLDAVRNLIKHRKARMVDIVCLLDKRERRVVDIEADYVGFVIPDKFVVGYGLDFNGKYRNLDFIGVLKEEVYEV